MKRNLNYETEYYNYSLQLYRRKIIILCCLEELLNRSAKYKHNTTNFYHFNLYAYYINIYVIIGKVLKDGMLGQFS